VDCLRILRFRDLIVKNKYMNIHAKKIEALLFASGKPMTRAQLKKLVDVSDEELNAGLEAVGEHLGVDDSGIALFESQKEIAIVTDPGVSDTVREFLRKDVLGELSRPSVETLAIIAYRGPATKPEIEQIRGVNCTIILRNLMIRGLIDEENDGKGYPRYTVSMEYLKHLGVDKVEALPDYEALHEDRILETLVREES